MKKKLRCPHCGRETITFLDRWFIYSVSNSKAPLNMHGGKCAECGGLFSYVVPSKILTYILLSVYLFFLALLLYLVIFVNHIYVILAIISIFILPLLIMPLISLPLPILTFKRPLGHLCHLRFHLMQIKRRLFPYAWNRRLFYLGF